MSVENEVCHYSLAVVRAAMGHDRGMRELREADRAGIEQDRLGPDIAVGDTFRGNPNLACDWSGCMDNDIVHTHCAKSAVAHEN